MDNEYVGSGRLSPTRRREVPSTPSGPRAADRLTLTVFLLTLGILAAAPLRAATVIWSYGGSTSLASDNTNWIGSAAPAVGDYAVFGSTTPNAPCTWDLNIAVSSLVVTGSYSSTVTLSADLTVSSGVFMDAGSSAMLDLNGRNLSVQGDWTVGDIKTTSTVAGSSVTFYGVGPSNLTRTTGAPARFNNLVIKKDGSGAGSAETLRSDIEVYGNFTVLTGTHASGAHSQYLHQDLVLTAGYLDVSVSTVVFNGTRLQRLTVNGSGVANTFGVLSVQNQSTVYFPGVAVGVFVATQPGTTLVFPTGSGTVAIASMTINGQAAGSRIQMLTDVPGGRTALNIASYSSVSFGYVQDLDASGGLAITANSSFDGGNNVNWTFPGGAAGTTKFWHYAGGSALASNAANWNTGTAPAAGDFVIFGSTTPASPCTWDLGITVTSMSITDAFASAVTLAANITISSGALLNAGGAALLDLNGNTLSIQGDWIVGDARTTSTVAGSTVAFFGGGVSNVKRVTAGPAKFNNLVVAKSPAGAGAIQTMLSDLEVFGNFSLLNGTHTAGAHTEFFHQEMSLGPGFLDESVSTIVVNGALPQHINGNSGVSLTGMGTIYVQNPASLTLPGISVGVLVATQAGTTLIFKSNMSIVTITSATFNGQAAASRIQLQSDSPGMAATVNIVTYSSASYVYVQDINSSGGIAVSAKSSFDGGDNTNWSFPGGASGTTKYWHYGGGSALASNAANWNTGAAPAAGDYVVFGSTTPASPCTWDLGIAISSLSITGAYGSTVTLTANLTVSSGALLNAGAGAMLDIHGQALSVQGDWIIGDMKSTGTVAASSVVFYGTGLSNINRTTAGPALFNNLVINKTSVSSGSLRSDLEIFGNFSQLAGNYAAGAHYQTLHHDLFQDAASVDNSVSTIVFVGPQASRIGATGAGPATAIATIYLQTSSTVTLPGVTVGVLVATQPGTTLIFNTAGGPITVTSMTISGQSAGTVTGIYGPSPGTAGQLKSNGPATVSYARVQDSDASPGNPITAQLSYSGGNNTNWTFIVSGVISASTFTPLFQTSFTANWNSTFQPGLTYTARISSGAWPNSFSGNASSDTFNLYASYIGLTPNTTYYLKVATAPGGNYTILNATPTLAAVPAGPNLGVATINSVQFNWTSANNGLGTLYSVLTSTASNPSAPAGAVATTSSTFNTFLSSAGLNANTTYFFQVQAINDTGIATAYTAAIGTVTAPLPPGAGAPVFSAMQSSNLTLNWTNGGNPNAGALTYSARLSSGAFPNSFSGNVTTNTAAASVIFGTGGAGPALAANTTYFFQVQSINASAGSSILSAGSTSTLAAQPAGLNFSAPTLNTVQLNWSSAGNGPGVSYSVQTSTASDFSGVTTTSVTFNTFLSSAGLSANTTYFFHAAATNNNNLTTAYTAVLGTSTLANQPAGLTFNAVAPTAGAIQLNWSSAGNGPATSYSVQTSTASDFSGVTTTSVTFNTFASSSGLNGNTTYFFSVAALNNNGLSSAYTAALGTSTLAALPAGLNFGAPAVNAIQFNWSSAGNGAATSYSVRTSTASDFSGVTTTSVTFNIFFSSAGLSANTTYFYQAAATNNNNLTTAYTAALGTSTLANQPTGPNFSAPTANTIQINWSSAGNGPGVRYNVLTSTAPDPGNPSGAIVTASATYNTFLSSGGVNANTTFFFEIAALNNNGAATAYTAAAGTSTLANQPTGLNFNTPTASMIQLNWSASGNGPGTVYTVLSSTASNPSAPAGAVVTTSATFNTFLSSAGLNANATYYFSVAAANNNNLATAFTAALGTSTLAAQPSGLNFSAPSVAAIQLNWSAAGNGPQTSYSVRTSTASDFSGTTTSSVTFNTFISSAGLSVNTTYFFQVAATNNNNLTTAYTAALGTSTLANQPTGPTFNTVAPTAGAIQLNWSSAGNGAGTSYSVQVSTASNFSGVTTTSATFNTFLSSSGLNGSTTYFFQVAAVNNNGVFSAYTAASGTSTLAALPTGLNFSAPTLNSLQFNWSSAGNGAATSYSVRASTASDFSGVTTTSVTFNTFLSSSGLNGNTTYFFQVDAVNNNNLATAYTAALGTSTLANQPTGVNFNAPTANAVQINWSSAGNGPGVRYVVLASTASDPGNPSGASATSSTTYNTFLSSAGLNPNTTYYFEVSALNNSGAATAFTASLGTSTLASMPTGLNFTPPLINQIQLNWSSAGNGPGTVYSVLTSTAANPSAPAGAAVSAGTTFATSFSSGGLSANASYYFQVAAINNNGLSTAYTAAVSTLTPNISTVIAAGFIGVLSNGLQANWNSTYLAGTAFTAQISTGAFPNAFAGNASSTTLNFSATFTGLNPSATYFAQVSTSPTGPFVSLSATSTLANQPAGLAFVAPAAAAIQLSWSAVGNGPATQYTVLTSTAQTPSAPAGAVVTASITFNTSLSSTGVVSNTTYYFQVSAANSNNIPTAYSIAAATLTLANIPSSPVPASVNLSSISLSWGAAGNPAGTYYLAQISTDAFASVNSSSRTLNLSAAFLALLSNETYYLEAQAFNSAAIATPFALSGATATPAAPALPSPPAGVGPNAATANWAANGNSPATVYVAQISTDGFATFNASSSTLNTSATFAGLTPNTAYNFQVAPRPFNGQALSYSSLPSTTTPFLPPAMAAPGFPSVAGASITVQWASGGNIAGTSYAAQISTDNFATVNFTSTTLNLSALLGAGGAGAALTPNTTYFFQARTTNGINNSVYIALGSTATLANPPASPVLTAVNYSSVSFNWSSNGDPAGTLYLAGISTDNFATLNASSATLSLSTTFQALTPNTNYFLRVQAVNWNGLATSPATLSTGTTAGLPSGVAAALYYSSAGLVWGSGGNPSGTVYAAQISTDNFATLNVSSQTLNLSAAFQALLLNTTYFLRVQALGGGGAGGPFATAAPAATLANPPLTAVLAAVNLSSIAFNWGANGDPAGTSYLAQISTDNFATVSASSLTLSLSATFFGLLSNSTYYLQVSALNYGGIPTSFATTPATSTLMALPLSLPPSNVQSFSLTANWGSGGNSPGTIYIAQISNNGFASVLASSSTYNAFANFSGLSSNTPYNLQVQAIAINGRATPFVALPSTTTLLLPPAAAAPVFTTVQSGSVTVQWANGGNGPATIYAAQISTDNFATVNFASTTLNLSVLFGAGGAGSPLVASTQYFFQVKVVNGSLYSQYLSLGSTSTLPAIPGPPSGPVFSAVAVTSSAVNWSSGTPAGGYNAPGTSYLVQASTASDFSGPPVSSQTYGITAVVSNLGVNSLYYFRVSAINANGIPTPFIFLGSTATLTAPLGVPAPSAFFGISTNALTLAWGGNGNPAGAAFYIQISSVPGGLPVLASSQTAALSASFGGLSPNTTYYAQGAAYSVNSGTWSAFTSLQSSSTLAVAPATPAAAQAWSSSVSWTWANGGNPAPTVYWAQISTDNFATISASSLTLNNSAVFLALAGNTTYYLRASAVNWNGLPSAFSAAASTVTLTSPPIPAGATNVGQNSITANWGANGNSAGTSYLAQISADNFVTVAASSNTQNTFAVFSGLAANITYYFRVLAAGNGGATVFVTLSTAATSLHPPAPAPATFATVDVASITLQWASGGNSPGTSYIAQISTDNFTTVTFSSNTANLSVLFGAGGGGANLSFNTAYYFRVQSFSSPNGSPFTGLGSTQTLAAPPAAIGASSIQATSATIAWSLNGNPAATVASLERSPDGIVFAQVSSGPVTSYVDAGLAGCTPYYYRVRNWNTAGRATSYNGPLIFTTQNSTPAAPGEFSAASLAGSRIGLAWTGSPSSGITQYKVYYDAGSGVINYSLPLAVLAPSQNSFTTGALSTNTPYKFGLRATNACGVEDQNTGVTASAKAVAAPSALAAAVKSPGANKRIEGNRVTVLADLLSGDASHAQQVLFEYRFSTGSAWMPIVAASPNHPNPSLTPPFFTQWDVTGLTPANYDLMAVATDIFGSSDAAPGSVTIAVAPPGSPNYDINENAAVVNGKTVVQKSQLLQNGVANTILISDDLMPQTAKIVLPAGALSSDSVLLTVIHNPVPPGAAAPGGVTSTGLSLQVSLGNGQTLLSGGQTAAVAFSYSDSLLGQAGLQAQNLLVYSSDGTTWKNDLTTSIDAANHLVTGNTPHFSFFAVFGTPTGAVLSSVRVFPSPYLPNGGDPNQGKPFKASDPTSGILFSNLPASSNIKIFTLTGQAVAEFNTGAGPGTFQWDARNDSGRDVASGGYFAIISSPGQKPLVKKFAIIR